MGAEVVSTGARDLSSLSRAALDVAVDRAADAAEGGFVLVRVPPPWLEDTARARPLLRWVLLFSSPERRDLLEAYRLSKRVRSAEPEASVGLTIHGVRGIAEAEEAFGRVAGVSQRHLGRPLRSYGLLVDDLHVYRAIASRRAIGLEHPQSRAARALQDVARLLLEDARQDACLG
jgi:MinD-like ATPase involved in chromosome partitioning or flagellar assembly